MRGVNLQQACIARDDDILAQQRHACRIREGACGGKLREAAAGGGMVAQLLAVVAAA